MVRRCIAKELGGITPTGYRFNRDGLGSSLIIKLPFMRKEKDMCIYNSTYSEKYYYLQGDNCCMKVSKEDGKAIYTNKGQAPMDFYLTAAPTHAFTLPMEFVQEIKEELEGNKKYLKDGSIMLSF